MEVFFISLFGIWADCERIYYAELTPLRLKQYIREFGIIKSLEKFQLP